MVCQRGQVDAMALFELTPSQQVHRMVMRHTQQPRQQPTPARLIRGWLPPQLEEGLLDYVFGPRTIAQQPHRERVDAPAVAFVDQLERHSIASHDRFEQRRFVLVGTLQRSSR
jgi:hypothetical protein